MTEWNLPVVTMPGAGAPQGVREAVVFPELEQSPTLYAPPDWSAERLAETVNRLRKAAGLDPLDESGRVSGG